MVVHNLEVWTSQTDANGGPVDIETIRPQFQDWIASHDEVLGTQSSDLSAGNTGNDGTGVAYFVGSWRFAWAEDLTALRTDITGYLTDNFEWWRLRYHQCDHDEADRAGCSWDNSWEGGSVPPEVPTI